MSANQTSNPVTPLMRMGCTNQTITYRSQGLETVCLQSPSHGVQQLAGFDPAKGDVIGVDDILELTTAATDLSDIAEYITSVTTGAGTELYFDATGQGLQGTAIAMLQGVSTNVAALVADGGMQYIPDAITIKQSFGTTFTFRPAGLQTLVLEHPAPGVASTIDGFNPLNSEVLDLHNILNKTAAAPNLSNIDDYITATQSNGNTILSFDKTGSGRPGQAFATLEGVDLTVDQIVVDHGFVFSPTPVSAQVHANTPFVFRPEGEETAVFGAKVSKSGPATIENFSPSNDILDIHQLLAGAGISATAATIGNYISATQTGANGANETLWLDPTGQAKQTTAFAVLQSSNFSVSSLTSALHFT